MKKFGKNDLYRWLSSKKDLIIGTKNIIAALFEILT